MNDPTSKVDIWALGIILNQLLSKKHPFQKKEFVQTLKAILDHEPEPLPESISTNTKLLV
jgi:serine/threonine protein kinase